MLALALVFATLTAAEPEVVHVGVYVHHIPEQRAGVPGRGSRPQ